MGPPQIRRPDGQDSPKLGPGAFADRSATRTPAGERREHVTTWWCEVFGGQPGADVVPEAPVPGWGWGVAPPCQP